MKAVQFISIPRLSPLAAAIALALPGSICQAQAQEQEAQAAPAKLEAVVVTANKRKEKLMEVPAAITVLDEATLERSSAKSLDDLTALSPALTITYSTQPGNYSINMRGVGTFSLGIGVESDVAVTVDDIPFALQANAFKDLADLSRVEVLKGPQSTLFGKSAIAGALNLTTKPIQGALKTTTSALVTNDGETRLGVAVSGEVTDRFRARVAASSTKFVGTVTNLTNNTHLNGNDNKTVLGKFEWSPTDTVTVTLSPRYNRSTLNCCVQPYTSMGAGAKLVAGAGSMALSTPIPVNVALAGINIGPDNVSVRNDYPAGGSSRDSGVGLKVDYAPEGDSPLAGHVLSSITSFSKYHMNDYQDGDATDSNVVALASPALAYTGGLTGQIQYGSFDVKAVTQEFRLTSPDKRRLRYVAGLWYGKNELARELTRLPGTSYSADYASTAYNINYAIYGQGTLDLTSNTSLIAGLRLNHENSGYTFTKFVAPAASRVVSGQWAGDDAENSTTGRIGLEHRFSKDVMSYGTYSTGHKGVAYDLTSSFSAATAANSPVASESARSWEIGTKATLLDERATISVALFKTDFYGFQLSAGQYDPDGVFRTSLHSIGQMETRGVEVDGSFRVSRALMLNGSFAYMKAYFVKFPNGSCYAVANAAGTGTVNGPNCATNAAIGTGYFQDLKGKPLPNAPKIKVNLGGQYDIALPAQSFDLFVNSTYRWQSATLYNVNQDPGTIQGAYGILNAGFGMKGKGGGYKLSAFVNNLLDKRYAASLTHAARNGLWSVSGSANVETTQWTPPRDYTRYFGVKLDLSF